MRLALVTRRYPPLIGGAEKVLSYLAAGLAAEGAAVTVLTAHAPGLPARETVATPAGSLTVERLPTSRLRIVGTWLYMRNLARWFDANPVDLAYVSMLKHDAYVVTGAGRRKGFPVVLRPEGAGATGDLAWQSWGRFGATIGNRCRTADALVSISAAVTAELRTAGYSPSKIHELPNGVPIPDALWQPPEEPRTAPRAVYVGRLAPEKGLDVLISAWPAVVAVHPRAELVLIGEGPERPALEALVARLGMSGSIRLPGKLADPIAELRTSDLFVLPSREEGMSIALLEAMALGIPLVASAIPGNLRLVQDRVHGRLAPPDDPQGLASAILAQWADRPEAARWGQAAREAVAQNYSIAAVAQRHLALFRALAEGSV